MAFTRMESVSLRSLRGAGDRWRPLIGWKTYVEPALGVNAGSFDVPEMCTENGELGTESGELKVRAL